MTTNYSIIDAPSILGLFPRGVEDLSKAVLQAGLANKIGASVASRLASPAYSDVRDPGTGFLNGSAAQSFALQLAKAIAQIHEQNHVPIILGGDCSILHGALVALKRRGRYGLMYLDGHADFFRAHESPTGEIADMGLAIAVGQNHPLMADIEGLGPYIQAEDAVLFGYRDEKISLDVGMQPVRGSGVHCFDLDEIRARGFPAALAHAVERLTASNLDGIFIHFDADVLDDGIMPAVDYRLSSGLSFEEVAQAIQAIRRTGKFAGLTLTIFNPKLDTDGSITRNLVGCLVSALTEAV